jgi:hypothetical protein
MKLVLALFAAGVFLARRRIADTVGPAARARCAKMCDRILANMPESFPPNRIMADLDVLKQQTSRVLDTLEQRDETERLGD